MKYSKRNAGQQAGSAADEAAIRDMTSDYTAAVAAGDLQQFLSVFPDDVVVMPPDHPTARGRDAFTTFVKPFFDEFTLLETISYDEIRVAEDWAVGTFAYSFTTTPKAGGLLRPAIRQCSGRGGDPRHDLRIYRRRGRRRPPTVSLGFYG